MKRQNAYIQALKEAQNKPDGEEIDSQETQRSEVTNLTADQRRKLKKTSCYFSQNQLDKMDELTYAYKKRTGNKLNRNEVVRMLVENCTLEQLMSYA